MTMSMLEDALQFPSITRAIWTPESAAVSADDALSTLGRLVCVAWTLASARGLPHPARPRLARALRDETAALRRELAGAEVIAPARPRFSVGPEILRVASSAPPLDLQGSILDALVHRLDVRRLGRQLHGALGRAPSKELVRIASAELEKAAALLDVAVARTGKLVAERTRSRVGTVIEMTLRACADAARYRHITILAAIDRASATIDADLLGRALVVLAQHAIASMPAYATLQFEVTTGRTIAVDVSFTGQLCEPASTSWLGGLELVFVREALAAHGADVHVDVRGGRTIVRTELSRSGDEATRLERCA